MNAQRVVIGIDPGKTGAIAVVGQSTALIWDWPGDEQAVADLVRDEILFNSALDVALVAIEGQQAMPKQGVSSTFKLGANFGVWLGVLAMTGWPVRVVRPQEWQRGLLRAGDGEGKDRSLAAARRLFPAVDLRLKKHNGRADALLIAYWAWREIGGK
jgi:crossover junction endodeoxyribonuclease RuvC